MKIAISLITCNDLEYLKPCLESLFKSDLMKHIIKLFICDNGSSISHRDYLNKIAIDKYIILNPTNEGIVIPRIKIFNEIIKEDFDFLLEIHSDMIFPEKWLMELLKIDEDDVAILEPHIFHPGRIVSLSEFNAMIVNKYHCVTYEKCKQVHPWLIKMKHIDAVGGYYDANYSPQQCEDDDFVYRVIMNKFKIKSTGLSWVCHYGGAIRHGLLSDSKGRNVQYFETKHKTSFRGFTENKELFKYHPAFR